MSNQRRSTDDVRRKPTPGLFVFVTRAAAIALLFCGGCRSAIYTPSALPLEYHAPPAYSARKVDLASLANHDSRSDIVYEGDVLEVIVATGTEEEAPPSWMVRIDERGMLSLPLIGPVPAGGTRLTAVEQAIRQACIERGVYRHPLVTVRMKERRSNQVTVLGEITEPGVYQLPRRSSDLVAALAAAQGLTEEADTLVEIRQPPPSDVRVGAAERPLANRHVGYDQTPADPEATVSERVDLVAAAARGARHYLEDGAVVVVRQRPRRTIHVMGLVNAPNEFELPADEEVRVLDAIALAGGLTVGVADSVRVIRQLPDREQPVVIDLSLRDAKHNGADNLPLAPGDLVSVEETPVTFVVDLFRSFVRFGFASGVDL